MVAATEGDQHQDQRQYHGHHDHAAEVFFVNVFHLLLDRGGATHGYLEAIRVFTSSVDCIEDGVYLVFGVVRITLDHHLCQQDAAVLREHTWIVGVVVAGHRFNLRESPEVPDQPLYRGAINRIVGVQRWVAEDELLGGHRDHIEPLLDEVVPFYRLAFTVVVQEFGLDGIQYEHRQDDEKRRGGHHPPAVSGTPVCYSSCERQTRPVGRRLAARACSRPPGSL